jgi:hypothetical protein
MTSELTPAARPFTLEDQYGTARAVAFGEGRPAVVVFADRSCADDVEPWARRLSDALGERADVIGVAAVGTVPTLFQSMVRAFLAGRPSVLLDWGNEVSAAFGYAGGECAVVAVDGAGTVRADVRGALSEAGFARVVGAVGG